MSVEAQASSAAPHGQPSAQGGHRQEPVSAGGDRRARYAAGKALRKRVSREALAEQNPAARDAVAILRAGDVSRIVALVPIRYARMAANPFAFLRGAAAVMASDLARAPSPGLLVQACGDAHLLNFGAFATPEGRVLFDLNDFDETLPGIDFTVDLKRLVASAAVAAEAAGWSGKKARVLAANTCRAYREHMRALAQQSPLAVWHEAVILEGSSPALVDPQLASKLTGLITRARDYGDADDNFPHLAKSTSPADWRRWKIADKPPTIYHLDATSPVHFDVLAAFSQYQKTVAPHVAALLAKYTLIDHAVKVVGVGSVGTFCAVGLFSSADGDPLFLQIKEASTSVLERLNGAGAWTREPGERVVQGQRMLQAASDAFLGWCRDEAGGRDLYVRQLKNRRLGTISEIIETADLMAYAALCGRTLARAHARSADPATLAGYMGRGSTFDDAMASFAAAYVSQTKQDHSALVAWRLSQRTSLP